MNRPAFLDQPEAWTRATRDSRSIARQSTPIEGPYSKPIPIGHRFVEWLVYVLAVVLVGAVAVGVL